MATATVLLYAIATTIADIKCIPKHFPITKECQNEEYDCRRFDIRATCLGTPQRRACCKFDDPDEVHWDLVQQYQDAALQAFVANNMQYSGNAAHREELQKETWIKHDGDYRMYVLPLRESEIANVVPARYQLGGQLNGRLSGSKKPQIKANMDRSTTECGREREWGLETEDGISRCDARVKVVHDTDKDKPYSRIGLVHSRRNIGTKYEYFPCSGTVVGSKWVLTAGHCIADRKGYIAPVESMRFYAQLNTEYAATYNPNSSPPRLDTDRGTYKVSAVYLPYGFIMESLPERVPGQALNQDTITKYDIALMELAQNVNTGYLGFEAQTDDTIRGWINDNNDQLITIGYPGDRINEPNNAGYRHPGGILRHRVANPMGRPFKMHKGFVLGKGRTDPNDATSTPFTEIFPKRFRDHKYKTKAGQSGSSIFHWYSTVDPAANTGYLSNGVLSGSTLPAKFRFSRWCRITALKGAIMNFIINGGTNIISDTGIVEYTVAHPPQLINPGDAYARMEYDNLLNENLVYNLNEIRKELETDAEKLRELKNRRRRHHKYKYPHFGY